MLKKTTYYITLCNRNFHCQNWLRTDLWRKKKPYLYKHLSNRRTSLVGRAVHGHGLPVSGKFQGKLLLHQLLNHLKVQQNKCKCESRTSFHWTNRRVNKEAQMLPSVIKTTYWITGVGSLNLRQAFNVCIKHVHLFNQARESCFRGLANLLIYTFGLHGTKNHQP